VVFIVALAAYCGLFYLPSAGRASEIAGAEDWSFIPAILAATRLARFKLCSETHAFLLDHHCRSEMRPAILRGRIVSPDSVRLCRK
jgi:hypothetical protein